MTDSTLQNSPAPVKRKHSPSQRVEYALARSLEKAVSILPEKAADSFGAAIGRRIHDLGIRRDTVDENLRIAFPDASSDWIEQTRRAAYEHLGREAAAMLRLSKLDEKAVVDRTILVGWDEVQEALSLGRGLILVTGHYGNWEIAAGAVASRCRDRCDCPATGEPVSG